MASKSLTVREAAEVAGVSPSTIQGWREGSMPTDFDAVRKLAERLGVTLGFLLTGYEDKKAQMPSVNQVFKDGGTVFDGYLEVHVKRLVPRVNNYENDKEDN